MIWNSSIRNRWSKRSLACGAPEHKSKPWGSVSAVSALDARIGISEGDKEKAWPGLLRRRKFWEKRSIDDYWKDLRESDDAFERPRLTPVTVKFDSLVLKKIKMLAKKRGVAKT